MSNKKIEDATSAKVASSEKNNSTTTNNNTKNKNSQVRGRNFAKIVYPESAPENWLQILDDAHVPALVSPLHDKDLNPDGTRKKPHYHVMVMFTGKKSQAQADALFDTINGVGHECVQSARGYARYLCHLDNPEKHLYNVSDVRALGGADYYAITSLPTDDLKVLKEMIEFIRVQQISSFAQFADICSIVNDVWFRALTMKFSYFIDKYIKSMTWEDSTELGRSTEEILNSIKED